MSDPVAEAAANLAALSVANMAEQQTSTPFLENIANVVHDLEAKVEHLIHPEAEAGSAEEGKPIENGSLAESTPSADSGPQVDAGNVVAAVGAGVPEAGAAHAAGGELPNAVSDEADSTTVTDSAASVSGSGETSSIVVNSVSPLHVRIATHLEAIYRLAESAPAAAVADTSVLKTHVGYILHRISNGMAVTEGELVQKLEALYRML